MMNKRTSPFFSKSFAASLLGVSLLINPVILSTAYATGEKSCDRVTYGGFITKNGAKVTFGGNAGRNAQGKLFINLNVIDHGVNGPRFKATAITGYAVQANDPGKRRVNGIATNKGGDLFTFVAIFDDNGESGSSDTFFIRTEGGYTAGGSS